MDKSADADDEFFGDQSSDEGFQSNQSQLANHEYRSRESSVKTLSYLDGYDETKEEKLQKGFGDGYRESFPAAFRIGEKLGSMFAGVALSESATLGVRCYDGSAADKGKQSIRNSAEYTSSLVRQFLTNEILIVSAEGGRGYTDALVKLDAEMEKSV